MSRLTFHISSWICGVSLHSWAERRGSLSLRASFPQMLFAKASSAKGGQEKTFGLFQGCSLSHPHNKLVSSARKNMLKLRREIGGSHVKTVLCSTKLCYIKRHYSEKWYKNQTGRKHSVITPIADPRYAVKQATTQHLYKVHLPEMSVHIHPGYLHVPKKPFLLEGQIVTSANCCPYT